MKQVLVIIFCIAIGVSIGFYSQSKTYLNIKNICDSLKSENFVKDLNIMRYENIIEKISEDTICKKILDKNIKETE
jgi:hypothetical protein